jgi:hypothetical protein
MTAGKTTAQVFGLFGLLATAISLGFTAADVASNIARFGLRRRFDCTALITAAAWLEDKRQ